jgi:hypothetical protein
LGLSTPEIFLGLGLALAVGYILLKR